MSQEEAVQLLLTRLPIEPTGKEVQLIQQLAQRLGEWPLLLSLANRVLWQRVVRSRDSLGEALSYLQRRLDTKGVVAFDATNAQERSKAVAKTIEVSLEQLRLDERMRFEELAIFPEDVPIPLATVHRLWQATGNLDDLDTEDVCQRLYSLSLLQSYDLQTRSIRLHDVIRSYLQLKAGAGLSILHERFLDAYGLGCWADLAPDEPYLWAHLAEHLVAAGRLVELLTTVKDLRYLANKTLVRTAYAAEADLALAERGVPADMPLRLLRRNFANMGHLLNRCCIFNDIAAVLYSRLVHLKELSDLCQAFEQNIPRPFLTSWHLLPDLPDPALIRTLRGHTDGVYGCAISPAGDYIVSASGDQTLKVWDAHTGQERRTLSGHTDGVRGCAISSAGDYIVSACYDQTLKVWDARTGQERRTLSGHTAEVYGCAISSAGDYIVSASYDQTLKVWDARTGQERCTLRGHTDGVRGCAISPAGDYIVSASWDQTLKVWDTRTGQERCTLRGHTDGVYGCAISPAGDYIVSASEDDTLKVWDTRTGQERCTLRGHRNGVRGCAISPAGDYIVSACYDQTLKVWDTCTGQERRTLCGHTKRVYGCAISPAGDYIVSASWDQTLKVWDTCTGQERRALCGHKDEVYGCAISPAGDYIVSACYDQTLKVWDARTGQERRTLRGHTNWVRGCAISPAGDYIVSASWDQTLKVWDTCTGQERRALCGHKDEVYGCAISPAETTIVSASGDQTLKVWDAHTGQERRTLSGHTDGVIGCAISPAGDYIVSASWDQMLKVWDARTGQERRTLSGHTGGVTGCAISPAGDYIVSASYDQTLKVWDADTGECLSTLYVNGQLNACAFHRDGEHIVAVGAGGVYFLWWVMRMSSSMQEGDDGEGWISEDDRPLAVGVGYNSGESPRARDPVSDKFRERSQLVMNTIDNSIDPSIFKSLRCTRGLRSRPDRRRCLSHWMCLGHILECPGDCRVP